MTDATLETIDGRPALRFERKLAHSVERVWRAVSEPGELEQWFPAVVPWTPAVGEVLEVSGMTGKVTAVEPQRLLAWNFEGDEFSFELDEHEGGCVLVFTHVFDDRATAAQAAAGWETYLMRLDVHLEGGYLSEQDAHKTWPDIHERYAELFGIDPAAGRQFWAEQQAG